MGSEKCDQRDLTMIQAIEILRYLVKDDVEDYIEKKAHDLCLKETEITRAWIKEQLKDIEGLN